ncbi:class I SAM-dependent methyltransferase [Mucilaginibacter sp. UYCu711]|uniref:class I SAM-dependent methyltransferase n=1 Tax=Mucilaginibacter sp. UYCu711 TaxID=3156339 RepID=UPI003D1D5C1A
MRYLKLMLLLGIGLTCPGLHAQQRLADSNYTYKPATPDGTGKYYKGREIAHVMGFEGAAWLERNTREQEENTKKAIAKLPITAASVVADIGAGTGYYTFPIAAKVPQGKVYAVEIQQPALTFLKQRSTQLNLNNVIVVRGGEKSPNLPDNVIDLAIMVDVYHELSYPHEMLQAIRRSLKKDGKLLLLEYRAEDPTIEIKPLHKTSIYQLNKELNANGFHLKQDGEFMPIQHFLVYQKD